MKPERRRVRLQSDYTEMCNIRGAIIDWKATAGSPPEVEEYQLTVNVRSIISPKPDYRDRHVLTLQLPPRYPYSPPVITMVTEPVVFHPNWWPRKQWCGGSWAFSESLGSYVIRMIRTLQYDPAITDPDSAANYPARDWYLSHQNQGLFPCDRQRLPDPGRTLFEIQAPVRRRFEIKA